jgi:undecaprenyl phosphate N,N'-diacetylbacillosamine 1-phosphate transferase
MSLPMAPRTMRPVDRAAKRLLDLVIAFPMLVLLALPLLIAGLAIKIEGGGPVFFRQIRVGRCGKTFRVWKFRTMTETRLDPHAPDRLEARDARITRVGRLLRSFGLDELPQLLNVLAGEMSLVGPRPTLTYQVAEYDDYQRRRLEAKPGITSLAVVSGRNALPWVKRIELDVWYIDHWSLGLDLQILFKTLWKVLVTREGLYGPEGFNDEFVGKNRDPL